MICLLIQSINIACFDSLVLKYVWISGIEIKMLTLDNVAAKIPMARKSINSIFACIASNASLKIRAK